MSPGHPIEHVGADSPAGRARPLRALHGVGEQKIYDRGQGEAGTRAFFSLVQDFEVSRRRQARRQGVEGGFVDPVADVRCVAQDVVFAAPGTSPRPASAGRRQQVEYTRGIFACQFRCCGTTPVKTCCFDKPVTRSVAFAIPLGCVNRNSRAKCSVPLRVNQGLHSWET